MKTALITRKLDSLRAAEEEVAERRAALARLLAEEHDNGASYRELAEVVGLSLPRVAQLCTAAREELSNA